MITLTIPGKPPIQVDERLIVRIRASLPSDPPPVGHSQVTTAQTFQIDEPPEEVASAVGQAVRSLARLTLLNNSSVWINMAKASGPIRISAQDRSEGYKSAVTINHITQRVIQTPQEISDLINAAGGTPEPIIDNWLYGAMIDIMSTAKSLIYTRKLWE